jgi:hypothetical protein
MAGGHRSFVRETHASTLASLGEKETQLSNIEHEADSCRPGDDRPFQFSTKITCNLRKKFVEAESGECPIFD